MKKSLITILLFCLFIFISVQGFYFSKNPQGQEEFFLVKKGDSVFQIGQNLEQRGFIKNKYLFNLYVLASGKQSKLQAGEYVLSSSMSISKISQKLISGNIAKEIITIPEGWNLRDIAWYFENKGMFQAEELYEMTELEGYLFPDTYEISRGASLEEIVKKMTDNFNKKLTPELREDIQKQEKTVSEIVIIASLLEKEIQTLEDKKMVAGVLLNRLQVGMPLQVDATITYITKKQTTNISKEDTQIDSPYNTYKYTGLPLGPICNPGMESIKAAIYPQPNSYWYYLSTPEGETIFSKTLEEHNIAKAKYLK